MFTLFKRLIPLGLLLTILVAPVAIPEAQAARHYSRISVGMALQNHPYSSAYWRHNRAFRPHFRSNPHYLPFRYVDPWDRYPRYYPGAWYSPYVGMHYPVGFWVSTLPRPYTTVEINHTTYYVADGVYFRDVGRGYMVVEEPKPELPPQPQRTYPPSDLVVEENHTYMRSGPGKEHPVIGQAYAGQPLTILGEDAKWYYVQHPHGHYGWVLKSHTRPTGDTSEENSDRAQGSPSE